MSDCVHPSECFRSPPIHMPVSEKELKFPLDILTVLGKRSGGKVRYFRLPLNCGKEEPILLDPSSKEYRTRYLVPYVNTHLARGLFLGKTKEYNEKKGVLKIYCSSCKRCKFHIHLILIEGHWYILQDGSGCPHHADGSGPGDLKPPTKQKRVYDTRSQQQMQEPMRNAFPAQQLKSPARAKANYGVRTCPEKSRNAVRVLTEEFQEQGNDVPKDCKVGTHVYGFVPDQAKYGNSNEEPCKDSGRHMGFLQEVAKSLFRSGIIDSPDGKRQSLRVAILRGILSDWHIDSFGGITNSHLCYLSNPDPNSASLDFCCTVLLWPKFKSSVVRHDGKLYVPFHYDTSTGNLVLIGTDNQDCRDLKYYVFPDTVISDLEPVGDLRVVVCGIKGGARENHVQCMKFEETTTAIYDKDDDIMEKASWVDLINPGKHLINNPTIPNPRYFFHTTHDHWFSFPGWRYLHCFTGNAMVPRINAFHRHIRFPLTASNTIKSKTIHLPDSNKEYPTRTQHPFWTCGSTCTSTSKDNKKRGRSSSS